VVSPRLLHTLAPPGRRHGLWSPGRQGCCCTVPWRHGWPVSRYVRPGAAASEMVTHVGQRVGVLLPAASRLLILLIDVSADLLTAHTGPILLMSSVPTPASL
jgi:hypothetical protein